MRVTDVVLRLLVDLAAIAVLALGLHHRRHGRRDLVVLYVLFNVGLFVALVAISAAGIGLGVGFGLFAVLSIVRLRSETFTHAELGYAFVALVIALVCGVDLGTPAAAAGLSAIALAAAALIDHPRLLAPNQRIEVTVELVFADRDALRRHLEERLSVTILAVDVLEIDYVRETTRVALRCRERVPADPVDPQQLDARLGGLAG